MRIEDDKPEEENQEEEMTKVLDEKDIEECQRRILEMHPL
jgi:hypothetical protein